MMEQQTIPLEVFYSYAHEDEPLQKELEKYLKVLEREGLITTWQSREVKAGAEWKQALDTHLNSADIILLLLSPDFMASEFCYETEMKEALKRHTKKLARVIPIILRPVDWENTPLSELQVLPKSGKPITSWRNQHGRDKALLEVVLGIRDAITALKDLKIAIKQRFEETKARRASETRRTTDHIDPRLDLDEAIAKLQTYRASAYFARQNYEEALAIYEQALLLDSHDTAALRGKGEALQELQRYQEALVAYEQAIHLDPNDAAAYQGKGDVLYKLSRWWGALDAYEQAIRLDPNDDGTYIGKGDTLQALQRAEEALEAYGQAIRLDPNDSLASQRKADLAATRVRERVEDRPRKKTKEKVALAKRMFADKSHSIQEICATLGISRSTLYRYVKEAEPFGHTSKSLCCSLGHENPLGASFCDECGEPFN